ncbi:MAG: DUF805 domain-containing protein [Aureispira sp.]|nr:DUF805 domain-containing protein [Aureispira sp.]
MEWYKVCMQKYADFSGRARRSEFWYFFLMNFLIGIVTTIIDRTIGTFDPRTGYGVVNGIYSLAVFIPSLAVGARRLHDIGKSGWLQLIVLIPLVGIIVLIVFWATEGVRETNEYGRNPLNPNAGDEEDDGYDMLEHLVDK